MFKRYDLPDRIKALREGGQVTRCHTVPHIGHYSVAEHSYGVACLLMELWPVAHDQSPVPRKLLEAALRHDIAERWTGDIPHPAKKMYARLKEKLTDLEHFIEAMTGATTSLTKEEELWLKSCDMLELYLWALEQQRMGNTNVEQMLTVASNTIINNKKVPELLKDVAVELRDRTRRLNDFGFDGSLEALNERE